MTSLKCKIENGAGKSALCNIEFEGNLIIADIPQYTIETHTMSNNTISVVAPTNTLKDIGGSSRFTFLFNGSSSYSNIEYAVYYDTVTNEMFIINNPDYLDISTNENGYIKLYGYKIGSDGVTQGSGLSVIQKSNNIVLPEPTGVVTTVDVLQLNLHGISTRFSFNESKTLDIGVIGYEHVNLNTFVKVDKNVLFGTDTKLPLNTIYPNTMIKFRNKYIGEQNTNFIYIPIPV